MSGVDFLDTNVLICTVDAAHPEKRETAKAIVTDAIASQTAVISFQVVQETLQVLFSEFLLEISPPAVRLRVRRRRSVTCFD